jgi:hypothetical protein
VLDVGFRWGLLSKEDIGAEIQHLCRTALSRGQFSPKKTSVRKEITYAFMQPLLRFWRQHLVYPMRELCGEDKITILYSAGHASKARCAAEPRLCHKHWRAPAWRFPPVVSVEVPSAFLFRTPLGLSVLAVENGTFLAAVLRRRTAALEPSCNGDTASVQ